MKPRTTISRPDVAQPVVRRPVPPSPKYEKIPNPLWAINIAMAAFFIVVALVTMFS